MSARQGGRAEPVPPEVRALLKAKTTLERYREGANIAPDRLLEAARTMVAVFPHSAQDHAHMADAFMARGKPGDREHAIFSLTIATDLSKDNPNLDALDTLCTLWLQRFHQAPELSVLDQAIKTVHAALAATGDPAGRSVRLGYLGRMHAMRYDISADAADIDAALRALSDAEDHAQSPAERASFTADRAAVLLKRFEQDSVIDDLDRAIELLSAVVESGVNDPAMLTWVLNLGGALNSRTELTGSHADAVRALASIERANHLASQAPESSRGTAAARWVGALLPQRQHSEQATRLNLNLGAAVLGTYQHGDGNPGQLDRAIGLLERALTPDGSALRAHVLRNAPGKGAGKAPPAATFTDAVHHQVLRRALTRDSKGRQHWVLSLLAVGHGLRFDRDGRDDDLEAAILLRDEALAVMPADSPSRPMVLADLGTCLRSRHQRHGAAADLTRGMEVLRQALAGGLRTHVQAAVHAGRDLNEWALERGEWDEAAGAGQVVLEILHHQYHRQVTVEQKKTWLRVGQMVAGRVAVALVGTGDDQAAVTVLERARTLQLTDALTDVQPLTFQRIAEVSPATPLVYLTSSPQGGVVLTVAGGQVRSRALPELTEENLTEQWLAFYRAGQQRAEDPGHWRDTVDSTCQWLWRSCMGEVVGGLAGKSAAALIPCGPLAMLPLHAAWTSDSSMPAGRRYALDQVVLSYAPSARALGRATRLAETASTGSLVAVQDPRPAPGPALPFAAVEVAAAAALWSAAVILPGEQATRAAVLAALPDADVIHFACHGRADITDPDAGGLGLASGDLLTPGDLAGLSLRARLAVLSACETGVPGMDAPDEVAGLPTALLQAGVAGTVASLWEVTDAGTALMMVEFYRRWRLGAHPPALALREAQRWLRDSTAYTIRETFESLLDGSGWLPAGAARSCWQQVVLADPHERLFAEPVNWAAFAYSGS